MLETCSLICAPFCTTRALYWLRNHCTKTQEWRHSVVPTTTFTSN